jgi:hypothetical protein
MHEWAQPPDRWAELPKFAEQEVADYGEARDEFDASVAAGGAVRLVQEAREGRERCAAKLSAVQAVLSYMDQLETDR